MVVGSKNCLQEITATLPINERMDWTGTDINAASDHSLISIEELDQPDSLELKRSEWNSPILSNHHESVKPYYWIDPLSLFFVIITVMGFTPIWLFIATVTLFTVIIIITVTTRINPSWNGTPLQSNPFTH